MDSISAAHGTALVAAAGLFKLCKKSPVFSKLSLVIGAGLVALAHLISKHPIYTFFRPLALWNLSRAAFGGRREKWPLEDWIETYSEDALEPEIEIVDPHHHLWDPSCQPKGWPIPMWFIKWLYCLKPSYVAPATLPGHVAEGRAWLLHSFGYRQIIFEMPYMGRELDEDMRNIPAGKKAHNFKQTVYVECGWADPTVAPALAPVGEAKMCREVHLQYPNMCNGVVAHADLTRDDVEQALQAYSEMPWVKGIRHALANASKDPNFEKVFSPVKAQLALDKDFRRGFKLLEKYKLSYDTWCYHEQIPDIIDLVKEFPNQVIIVDHVAFPLGKPPYKREETFPVWEKSIKELAKVSKGNVYVKLSGLGMCNLGFGFEKKAKPPTSEQLAEAWAPYLKVVLDAFGVDKCMFASNFPVDKASCDYTVCWNAFKRFAAKMSEKDKRKLFSENARKVYRL